MAGEPGPGLAGRGWKVLLRQPWGNMGTLSPGGAGRAASTLLGPSLSPAEWVAEVLASGPPPHTGTMQLANSLLCKDGTLMQCNGTSLIQPLFTALLTTHGRVTAPQGVGEPAGRGS